MVVCGTLCASGFDPQDNFLQIDSKNAASLCTREATRSRPPNSNLVFRLFFAMLSRLAANFEPVILARD
jgi:hypothetical protein